MRITQIALASIVAVVSLLGIAGTAAAAGNPTPFTEGCTSEGTCAGWAGFKPDGEILTGRDNDNDGHGVHVYYWRGDTDVTDSFTVDGGGGSEETQNLTVPEGTEFAFYVCLYDTGGDQDCSDWIYDVA